MTNRPFLLPLLIALSSSLLVACQPIALSPTATPLDTSRDLATEVAGDSGESAHPSLREEEPASERWATIISRTQNSSEQAVDPAPITDLWQRTREGFQLDLEQDNPRINAELRWYSTHQAYLDRVSDRASRYMFYIVEEIEKRGMPTELALLPVVESAYDPFAYSHGRASGMWQFIPSTGRHFGLKQNWWYDGRRDVIASTQAALDYMQQLHQRFGDWELALAAYNSGGGTVARALRRNRAAGKPDDFWSLNLPRETRAYVPKLIALSKLVKAPDSYQVKLPQIPNQPHFEIVEIEGQIDLAQAARMAELEMTDLYQLNPAFNQWATDPDGPHRLLIPIDKAAAFDEQLAQLSPQHRVQWQRYKVADGDSLIRIAKNHNTSVALIKEINQLRGSMIRAGQTLLIPRPSANMATYSLSAHQRTLSRQQRNVSGKQKLTYTVRSGDSFWTISRQHKVTVRELARWNNMAPGDPLKVGKKLVIWGSPSVATQNRAPGVIRKVSYRVRSGDSLSRIADRFNVGVSQIKRWNTLDAKYLQPGQLLTLYVDVTKGVN
ncbi:lytic transglycosylase [Aestuariirhabdus litorea]|uniref:LysM peptidoglycan-binding domain-containing protein n=1 Tax=Aestuariirhabdus litorea TaxID=2528527 RepID=A0A3P3VR15_9GAMM|nr:LysM peptidoglycan-binding domain-containing protein [Aestuariirhabdus litorea]RRJ84894.1 LysM peptidoglycan-binding domain-containing protein [Aestuariirhabdus litorea]RWW98120.1 LysM peptidoglycan-binding domain-containing protein [Endozoicomonadaceae bacterium GTF-13]